MKKTLKTSAYLIAFVLLGILWYLLVVPYLFYITFASDIMKDQMRWDLIEFYGIAQEISWFASEGAPITIAEKICSVMGYVGTYGVLGWFLLGILLVFGKHQSQLKKWIKSIFSDGGSKI